VTVEEADNRGWNFAVASFLGALGVGLLTAIPSEDEWSHRLDESVIPLVIAAFLIWYFVGRNKYSRSWVPLAAIAVVLVIKAFALLVLEFNDTEDRGDDIGISVVGWAFLVIVGWNYFHSRQRFARTDS
jgi:hypothetical protein